MLLALSYSVYYPIGRPGSRCWNTAAPSQDYWQPESCPGIGILCKEDVLGRGIAEWPCF